MPSPPSPSAVSLSVSGARAVAGGGAMPGVGLCVNDHVLWSQRIGKEDAINGRARPAFSVRNVVNSMELPARFKPSQVDPRDVAPEGSKAFDPFALGIDPGSTVAKDLRACFDRQLLGPRERQMMPITEQQELGWYQMPDGASGLKTRRDLSLQRMSSSRSMPKLGIGWQASGGSGSAAAAAPLAPPGGSAAAPAPVPVQGVPGAFRPQAPYGEISPEARLAALLGYQENSGKIVPMRPNGIRERKLRRELVGERGGRRGERGEAVAAAARGGLQRGVSLPAIPGARPAVGLASAQQSKASFRVTATSSAAAMRQADDAALAAAMQKSRQFLNRHQAANDRWYHPLSNSDVSVFADEYTRSFGVPLYNRPPPGLLYSAPSA